MQIYMAKEKKGFFAKLADKFDKKLEEKAKKKKCCCCDDSKKDKQCSK